MRASAASRASFDAPTTSLLTRMSGTPPQASASASATFCTHWPTAPRAICSLRDHRRFVGLGMRAQLRAGRRQQLRHVVEIVLERVEIDQQRGRVDFVLAHAGTGGRWLQHGV